MTTFDKEEAIRIAEHAADIIDSGWFQGRAHDGDGNYCAIGALCKAINEIVVVPLDSFNDHYGSYNKVIRVLNELLTEEGYTPDIASFNDNPKTTQSEVSDLFRKAAKEIANNDN